MQDLNAFGVYVDDENVPQVENHDVKEIYQRAAQVNSGHLSLSIGTNDTLTDWYHSNTENERCHNTELMEEALARQFVSIPDWVKQKTFRVYSRAAHLYIVLASFFVYRKGTGSSFNFNWKDGTLRIVGSFQQLQNSETSDAIKTGHISSILLTDGPSNDGKYTVGKKLNYVVNALQFDDFAIVTSKKVDCLIDGKISELKTPIGGDLTINMIIAICIKCAVLVGCGGLAKATVTDGKMETIAVAELDKQEPRSYLAAVESNCYPLLRFIFGNLFKILRSQDSAVGRVTTFWGESKTKKNETALKFREKIQIDSECSYFDFDGQSWETQRKDLRFEPNWITPKIDADGHVTPTTPW